MEMRSRTTGTTNPSRQRGVVQPVYEDFKPMSEWIQDQEADILLIYLPGFLKENIKVSAEGKNIIRVRGERSVSGNKWHRLLEDYQVADYCSVRGTRARFEGGILTITVPKKTIAPSDPKDDHVPKPKPLTGPQKATTNDKDIAKSSQETPSGRVMSRTESTPRYDLKALAEAKSAQATTPGGVSSQAEPTPQDNLKSLAKAKSAQDTTPGTVARQPTPQDNSNALAKAKSAQENTTGSVASRAKPTPQDTSKDLSEAKSAKESRPHGVASQAKPTPQIISEATASQKKLSEPKSQEDRDNEGREERADTQCGFKQDDTMEGSETESVTTDKSEMSETLVQNGERTNAEKNNGSLLPDKADNVTKKIAAGVGLARADKNKNVKPNPKVANETGTSHFRLEKYKQSLKGIMELDEEKQLLLNVGVAMLVIVALGTYAFYRSRK